MKQLLSAQQMSHFFLKNSIQSGDIVVDATMGNGFDTLFLGSLVGETGHVYAFDIQQQALLNTKQLVANSDVHCHYHLILDGHQMIQNYIPQHVQVGGAIFNLGYLPQSDKSITTKGDTTIQALEQLLTRLRLNRLVCLVVYAGHAGGQDEKDLLDAFVAQLPQKQFSVLHYAFVNQKNTPPQLIVIEKISV